MRGHRIALAAVALATAPACALLAGIPDGRHLAATDGGGDAASGWCASAPTASFCDDFDDGSLAAWKKVSPSAGFVTVDQTESESPPESLHVSVNAGGDPASQVAYAVTTFAEAASRVEVRVALWPDSLVDGNVNYVMQIQIGENTLSLYVNTGKSAWQEQVSAEGGPSFPPDHNVAGALATSAWTDIDAVIDLTVTPATLTVKYGSSTVLSGAALDPSWSPAPWSLALGVPFLNDTNDARSFHYDDVAVWTSP